MAGVAAVKVIFCNADLSKKYKNRISIFLKELLRYEKQSNVLFDVVKLESSADEIFFFDQSSSASEDGNDQKLPVYDLSFEEPIGVKKEIIVPIDEKKSQGFTCFNCLGSHHLKDCTEEHDGSRIASNRRDLMDTSTVRYHDDDVQPYENSNIRPGRISDALRIALDLKSNQLPMYIYHMRIIGYPPGWMKEAEIEKSGLAVYDSTGHALTDDNKSSNGQLGQYDGTKFIKFPGFNAPVPEDMIDEWKKLRMMPLQQHQQLTEALKHKRVTISPEFKKRKKSDVFLTDVKKSKTNATNKNSSSTPNKSNANSTPRNVSKSAPMEFNNSVYGTPIKKSDAPVSMFSGSPLVNTGNPCKKLPDPNKFSVGISEYLPYENLPDAVGVYDKKLKGVLGDVREKLTVLNDSLS